MMPCRVQLTGMMPCRVQGTGDDAVQDLGHGDDAVQGTGHGDDALQGAAPAGDTAVRSLLSPGWSGAAWCSELLRAPCVTSHLALLHKLLFVAVRQRVFFPPDLLCRRSLYQYCWFGDDAQQWQKLPVLGHRCCSPVFPDTTGSCACRRSSLTCSQSSSGGHSLSAFGQKELN